LGANLPLPQRPAGLPASGWGEEKDHGAAGSVDLNKSR
jgi:hypothetical protein